ncbi:cholesterol 24-hydroxylase-like [Bolinopsis microptera]|uniref:cholesterol 24-hydroxylase-like n=1 Tax=Bolinopsis microptera TaxID=2820187 RepID=UPI003079F46D
MFLLVKLSVLLLSSYIALNLYLFWKRRQYRHFASFPIPISLKWFMGHLPNLRMKVKQFPTKNIPQILGECHNELDAETVVFALFTVDLVLTLDLNIIPKLLTDRKAFQKRETLRKRTGWCAGVRMFGNYGLVIDPGTDVWAAKRRIMDTAFTKSFLRTTMGGMNNVSDRLIEVLKTKAECGQAFEISELLRKTTFEAISLCGFNWSEDMIKEHGEAALKMMRAFFDIMRLSIKNPMSLRIPWSRLAEKRNFKHAVIPMRKLNREYLEKIREKAVGKENLLSYIIRANTCSDELTMEDVIDDYNVLLVAGVEPTSTIMACALWFISMDPHVYKKAKAEVDDVFGHNDQISFEDVQKLVYIEMIIKESMRLKGGRLGTARQCKTEATINEVYFPKGTQFLVLRHKLHVDKRYWKDPEIFDPERFSPASIKNIRPYTYMPFSTGPRSCIAKNFAILEMKVILANVLRNFIVVNMNPEEKHLVMIGDVTTRPMDGVNVKVFQR